MKTAFVLAFSLAAACFAADPKPTAKEPQAPQSPTGEVKRLGSVTWDLDAHKLVWTVQKGAMVNGAFVPTSEEKYMISPDKARMMVEDEERGFSGQEAISLHKLLDTLSLYCAESVVWWEEGQGTPVGNRPGVGTEKSKDKPVKVGEPESKPKPKYKVPAGQIIARAWF